MAGSNFESLNVPNHFIRHANFLGELTKFSGPISDFAFTLVRRGSGRVALRSVNFPDRFLRHSNFRIRLDAPNGPGDELFRLDSTFFFEQGLADPTGVSFRSVNFPDRYLKHRDFHLVLEAPGADLDRFHKDATFFRKPAAVLIDHGTELHPA